MAPNKKIKRGLSQVMFKYAPGATFSHPRHSTIEKVTSIKPENDERVGIANREDLLEEIYERVQANDGGVRGDLPPDRRNYAFVKPGKAFTEIFPRIFACNSCGKLHDYSGSSGWDLGDLADHGGNCLECGGRLYQILHVMLCPNCSNAQSVSFPGCNRDDHGYDHITLNDEPDQYKNFRWVCQECDDRVVGTGLIGSCDRCDTKMIPSVHSASQSHRVESLTQVDLGEFDVHTASLADDDADALILGSLFDMFDKKEHSIEDLAQASGASLQVDPEDLSDEEMKVIRDNVNLDEGGEREMVIGTVTDAVDDTTISSNLRSYVMLEEALGASDITPANGTRAADLCEEMGIDAMAVTSEFPLIACSYGYRRTYEDQNSDDDDEDDDDPEPAIRLFSMVELEDGAHVRPIYTKRSKTEALIVKLDPRKVGAWLGSIADNTDILQQDLPDFTSLDRSEARVELYELLEPVDTYTDIEIRGHNEDDAETPENVEVSNGQYSAPTVLSHRLLHSIAHLCMQNASMYSGIEETNFAEYLFPEALSFAIYAKQTESYTAGGLYTLAEQRLTEWLRGAYRDGEQCFYDSTCADIWDGACHACLHTGEVSCQHFNDNLSRVSLYGNQITDVEYEGYWQANWDDLTGDAELSGFPP